MKCEEVKDLLYEFITGRLEHNNLTRVEGHIKDCKACRQDAKKMRHTLNLVNEVKPPPLSADFKEKVMQRIHDLPMPPKPLFQRIKERIQVPYIKWPLEGMVAAAAIVLLTLAIYRGLTPEVKTIPREIEITATEVKNPIVIETRDIDSSFTQLKGLIQLHNGRLIRSRTIEGGIEVIFRVEKGEEEGLFKDLSELGKVQKEEEGYKDVEGNIVLVLKK